MLLSRHLQDADAKIILKYIEKIEQNKLTFFAIKYFRIYRFLLKVCT